MLGTDSKKKRDHEHLIFWKERGQVKEHAELMYVKYLEILKKIADRHNEFEMVSIFQSVIDKKIEEEKEREKPLPFEYLDKIKNVDLKDLESRKDLTSEESLDALNYKILGLFGNGTFKISERNDLKYLTRLYKESIRFQMYELSKMIQIEIDNLDK